MNTERYTVSGHNIIDNTTGEVCTTWAYDHAEFARSGMIYRVQNTAEGSLPFWTANLPDMVATWNRSEKRRAV